MASPDPYAPPATDATAPSVLRATQPVATDYAREKRPIMAVVALYVLTLGLYPAIWIWRRQPFLDALGTEKKLGPVAPVILVVANALALGVRYFRQPTQSSLLIVYFAAVGAATVVAQFRAAAILRADFARTGRKDRPDFGGVLILGCIYLQWLINRAAETPPTPPPKKRAKKRAKRGASRDEDRA